MARRLVELQYSFSNMEAYGTAFTAEYKRRLSDYASYCDGAADPPMCRIAVSGLNAEIDRVLEGGSEEIAAQYIALADRLALAFADAYTEKELTAVLAFVESPEGRSMDAKTPALTLVTAPIEYDAIRPLTDKLQSRIDQIIDTFGSAFSPEAPAQN
jgi:hypothetical protein